MSRLIEFQMKSLAYLIFVALSSTALASPCAPAFKQPPIMDTSSIIWKTRTRLRSLTNSQINDLMLDWFHRIMEERGRLPGMTGSPGEPKSFNELRFLIAQDPHHLKNIYSNYNIAFSLWLLKLESQDNFKVSETEIFDHLLIHEFAYRQLRSPKVNTIMKPVYQIYDKSLQNFLAHLERF